VREWFDGEVPAATVPADFVRAALGSS
jgi:hypothetical protein